MPTITGNELIARAGTLLNDPDHTRWSVLQLLDSIHDAQRDIVARKPDAYTKTASTVLTVSEVKHSLPSDAIMLLDVTRNMGTNGSTPGKIPTRIEKAVLDQQWPSWMAASANAEVDHWMYDEKDPLHFWVYPVQPASSPGYVELVYSAVPPQLVKTWQPSAGSSVFKVSWDGADQYRVLPTIRNDHMYYLDLYEFMTGTGTTEPIWPTGDGEYVVDGDFLWYEMTPDVPYPITLNDQYAAAILDYMVYAALSVDANLTPVAAQKAQAHFNKYLNSLGITEQVEGIYDPNIQSAAKPSLRGV